MSDSDLHQRVLAAFQTEFKEQMQGIRAMLDAWPVVSPATLDDAFRLAHSMKGSARVCDLTEVESIAHELENALSELNRGRSQPTPELKARLESLADAAEDTMAAAMTRELAPKKAETGLTAAEAARAPAAPVAQDTTRIESALLDDLVQSSGLVLSEATRQESLTAEMDQLARELEHLRRLAHEDRHDPGDLRFLVREAGKHLQQIRARQQVGARSLRVLSSQLQEHVNRICMVPISTVFEGFPKMMRDLAAETGRPVHFTMTGTELHADRTVLQALKDPVMHALRNALSHGIEPAAERRAAGKPEVAEVSLRLEADGQYLHLTLEDDGRGVNVDAVRQKALQAGLITATEAAQQPEEAILDLIFHPGFSTAQEVTRVAGRGMGLSVVRERAAHYQGEARMETTPGRGSRLHIELPLSISARRLLLFRAAGHTFALPLSTLHALVKVDTVHTMDGRSVIFWEGSSIQLTTAAEAAGVAPRISRGEDGRYQAAILQGQRPLALHVESFVGEIDALVRPLPPPAALSPHFSGGILTDEGSVILVLNPQTLADRCRPVTLQEEALSLPQQARKPTILVVDDSFTARTLQKSILETAGYNVRTAEDGRAALTLLHSSEVAVVVSDVQMPHLDGFGLLATMKSQPALANIPVILVTSLSSHEDQERGLALGADAYIVKERFDHQELLGIVRQLV